MRRLRLHAGFLSVLAVLVLAPAAAKAGQLYEVFLDGPSESPPVLTSAGIGYALIDIDTVAHTLSIDVTFSGLTGTTTNAHIHAPTIDPFLLTANVATQVPTFVGFPAGVTSGSYSNIFDLTLLSSFNNSFVTANGGTAASAEAALALYASQGRAYLNIHSSAHTAGEIRGFLVPVPEPSTWVLALFGGVGLLGIARRRRG